MKNKVFFFLSSLLAFTIISCQPHSKEKLIIGKWEVFKGKVYYQGKESFVTVSEKENVIFGTLSNPLTMEFTNRNELFIYTPRGNKLFFKYQVHGDTINFNSRSPYTILKLTKNELMFENEETFFNFDTTIDNPKLIYTFNCKRIE